MSKKKALSPLSQWVPRLRTLLNYTFTRSKKITKYISQVLCFAHCVTNFKSWYNILKNNKKTALWFNLSILTKCILCVFYILAELKLKRNLCYIVIWPEIWEPGVKQLKEYNTESSIWCSWITKYKLCLTNVVNFRMMENIHRHPFIQGNRTTMCLSQETVLYMEIKKR